MAGKKINQVPLVSNVSDVSSFLIPCSTGDGNAKAISVATMLAFIKTVLGLNTIPEYSAASSYSPGNFVTKNGKMYRVTAQMNANGWNNASVIETSLYNELLRMYGSDYEEVNFIVASSDNNLTLEDVEIGVVYGGQTHTVTIDENGTGSCQIPKNTNYVINVSDQVGYQPVPNFNYISNTNARTVSIMFYAVGQSSNYEQVRISAHRVDYSSFSSIAGLAATVNLSDGTTLSPVFDSNGVATCSVMKGLTYTIVFPSVANYLSPSSQSYTASLTQRYVASGYYRYIGDAGVFIVDNAGVEYTVQAWEEAEATRGTAMAIHINDSALSGNSAILHDDGITPYSLDFYISVSIATASKQICNSNTLFSNMPQVSSGNIATNIDGLDNMAKIKSFITTQNLTSTAITHIESCSLSINNHTYKPYIGAIGQLIVWAAKYDTFSTALLKANGSQRVLNVKNGNWWSSTQYNSSGMWYMLNGSPSNGNYRTYLSTVLPLFAY